MLNRNNLLAGTAIAGIRLTDNERRLGRLLRDGEGHPAPAPTPAPAPAPSDDGAHDDFSAFENSLEGDEGDDGDDKSSGDDVDPAPSDTGDDDGAPPPEGDEHQDAPVQKRIDELTAARREAEREAADLRRRLDELEKAAKPDDKGQKKERSPDERPDPANYEFGEADGKYIEDLAIWRADMRINERERQRQLDAEIAQVESGWNEAISSEDTKTKFPDFDEKVTKGADRGDWDLSPVGAVLVKASPVGREVAYHLATNPAESKRIAALHPFEQALELGRLEGRFMNSGEPKPAAKIASDAPEPPANRSRGAGGKFQTAADTDDFAAFDKFADGVLAKT